MFKTARDSPTVFACFRQLVSDASTFRQRMWELVFPGYCVSDLEMHQKLSHSFIEILYCGYAADVKSTTSIHVETSLGKVHKI